MISYLLANGKSGNITDPWALRTFYTRLYYANSINEENERRHRRPQNRGRPAKKTR
jgi:hypothetical protein